MRVTFHSSHRPNNALGWWPFFLHLSCSWSNFLSKMRVMFMSKQNRMVWLGEIMTESWQIIQPINYLRVYNNYHLVHVYNCTSNTKRINHSSNPADYILYYHPIVLSMTIKQLNSFLIHGHRAGKCYKILYVVSELPNTGIAMCTALLPR